MAIALKHATASGNLQQIQAGDSLQGDSFERLSGSGNLIVGSGIGGDELRLGSVSGLTRAMNDLHVDGNLDMETGNIVDVTDLSINGFLRGRRMTGVTPPSITTQQNNYDPANFGTADVLRQGATGNQTITGFAAPGTGDNGAFIFLNIDGVDTITLAEESASSSAANRITTPQNANIALPPRGSVGLMYSFTTSRWVVVSSERVREILGPTTATDNAVARWDGTTGRLQQNSVVTIADSTGDMAGVGSLTMNGALVGRTATSVTPAALAAQADNYDPASFGTADLLRQSSTGDQNISGFAAPGVGDNHMFWFANIDSVDNLTLLHESASSTAANRISTYTLGAVLLRPGDTAGLVYDSTSSRWRVFTITRNRGVLGPSSATDNAIARWNLTDGRTVQNSGVIIDDSNNISGVVGIAMGGTLSGRAMNAVTPTALAAQADNYDPTSFGVADILRQTATGAQNISGFAAPGAGDNGAFWFLNADASDTITLLDESASSTAANRISTHTGANIAVAPGESVQLAYDSTASRWQVTALASAGGSGDFTGPGSSTDNALVRFDGTGGKTGQNSGVIVDDSDNVSGVGNLSMDGALEGRTPNIIAPANLTAQVDDYNPSGFGTCDLLRQATDGVQTITGFAAPAAGENHDFVFLNADPVVSGSDILFGHLDGDSGASNQIRTPDGGLFRLRAGQTARFIYDALTTNNWIMLGQRDLQVSGLQSSIDNRLARWNGTSGTDIQQANGIVCDDSDNLSGVGGIAMDGTLSGRQMNDTTPAAIAAQANNYDPTDFGITDILLQTSTGDQNISGFAAPGTGDNGTFRFVNTDTTDTITLLDENVGSSAANRIATHTGADYAVAPGGSVVLAYDGGASRWRIVALAAAGGAGDFTGPGSSADNAIVRFDGTGGKTGQNSGVLVSDTDAIVGRTFTKISPTAIAAQQNNYDPTNFATADFVAVTLTGAQTITGFAAPTTSENNEFVLRNVDTVDVLTLAHDSGSSTAANRILTQTTADIVVGPGESVTLIYDSGLSRWVAVTGFGDVRNLRVRDGAYFDMVEDTALGATGALNWRLSNKQALTLTANWTPTLTDPLGAMNGMVFLRQNGTGNFTVTWPAKFLWPGGTEIQPAAGASTLSVFTVGYDFANDEYVCFMENNPFS